MWLIVNYIVFWCMYWIRAKSERVEKHVSEGRARLRQVNMWSVNDYFEFVGQNTFDSRIDNK